MADFIFKGDLDSLSTRQQEFITETLKKHGHETSEITIETVGKPGENYMATVKRIISKDINGDTFVMIAKIAPTNEIARKRTKIDNVFGNEAIMYLEFLSKLVELQKAAGVSKEELFRCAECYGVLLEPPHELILLEDLKSSNFVILDRFTPLTDNIVRIVLKFFAIYHSLSLVWKIQNPETFLTFKTKLVDIFGSVEDEDEEFIMFANGLESNILEVLNNEKYKMAVRNTVSKIFEDSKEIFKDQADSVQSVIIQGDAWTTNIMFRLEDNEPVECIMIDYQLSKVSNPVCDILHMIFNCTVHETISKYYHEWIQHYHFELGKSLANFGINVDSVYPKDQLDADLKKYSKIFLSTSLMALTMVMRKADDAAKFKQAMESGETPDNFMETMQTANLDDESIELLRSRIEGLIDSYRELGYLNCVKDNEKE